MKKYLRYSLALLLPAALASCNGIGNKTLSDTENATPGDSISYYFGQSVSGDFWLDTESDTTLRDEVAREQYIKGVQAGMAALNDADAYNRGVFVGVQIAQEIRDLKKTYPDQEFNEGLFLSALKEGLKNDTAVDTPQAKADLYRVLGNLASKKAQTDRATSTDALAKEAKKLGMAKVSEGLYSKVITKGEGPKLEKTSMIRADITASTVSGQMIGMQFPKEFEVGRNYSSPIIMQALLSMQPGETAQFLASPIDVAPRRYREGEFKPTDIIKFTIKVLSVIPAGESDLDMRKPEQK